MSRRYISDLRDQENVDEVFLANQKQLRPNRNGDLYLLVDLADRSGSLSAMLWNATDRQFQGFEVGDFVRVRGAAQIYNGAMQIIAQSVDKARPGEVDESDFFRLGPQAIDRLAGQLADMLRAMSDPHLVALAECFLMDEEFMGRFRRAPAGVKNHHAYHGGLLEHVVSMMRAAAAIAPLYEGLDANLLLMGCFLHDMGKIVELSYDRGFAYTDEGQMIGHVVMAVGILEKKIEEAERLSGEPLPEETALRLKHMIVSHHGEYEFGSPKLPMTPEAIALTYLDNLDAKLATFERLLADDPSVEGSFTLYNQALRRKLYRGPNWTPSAFPGTEV